MLDFETAQAMLKRTFDNAFTKKSGTAKQRVSMALICLKKVPCRDAVGLKVWAVSYCETWGRR